jgi:CHAT domain-containing protein
VTAAVLLDRGKAMYGREEFDSASAAFTAAIAEARQAADTLLEGRALTERGFSAWRSDRYAEARRDGEAGLALKRRVADREELFRSWNLLGLIAWNEGRLFDAMGAFDSAAASARAMDQRLDLAKAAGNRALVQVEAGDFRAAHQGLVTMLEAGRSEGDARVEANALTNLAMLEVRTGHPEAALPLLAEARARYRDLEYDTGEQTALAQLAAAHQAMGQLSAAFATIDTAVRLASRLDQPQEVAANLEVQAQLHRDVGEERQALALLDEAQRINTSLGMVVEQGTSLRQQAEILRGLGQGTPASRSALQALQAHRSAGATFEELQDLLLLAEIASEAGDPAATDRYLASARALTSVVDARSARASLALGEAAAALRGGQAARALGILEGAWADLTAGNFETEWRAWDLRADAESRLGDLEEAAGSAQRAVAAIERVRAGLGSESQRTSFLGRRVGAYARLVEVLLRLGRVEAAFEAADAMRGRALADHLRGPDPQAARVVSLQGRIDAMAREGSGSPEARTQLEEALAAARRGAPEPRRGDRQEGILGVAPTRAREVMAGLEADEAVLAYAFVAGAGHAFVVRPSGVRHVALEVEQQDLLARVRLARDVIAQPGEGRSRPVLEALHHLLVGPLDREGLLGGVQRLVIVPQGVLTYLPFAALRDSDRDRYLAETYVLSVVPSAGAVPSLRALPRPPVGRGTGFAPAPSRLPASRAELAAFQQSVPGASVLVGEVATERRARVALKEAGIVHIASHAELNSASPLYSRVELAGAGAGGEDDGRLEVRELLTLAVRSRLVFLSGCETGLGKTWATSYRTGEDYATLGQALLYAGAGAVVATLWRIEDQSAAALAGRFYVHLKTHGPAEALALAQRDLLASRRHASPYFWAGHVVVGLPGAPGG